MARDLCVGKNKKIDKDWAGCFLNNLKRLGNFYELKPPKKAIEEFKKDFWKVFDNYLTWQKKQLQKGKCGN